MQTEQFLVSIQKWHLLAPGGVSRFFEILKIAKLFLRFQKCSSLARNQNLPFLDGHHIEVKHCF